MLGKRRVECVEVDAVAVLVVDEVRHHGHAAHVDHVLMEVAVGGQEHEHFLALLGQRMDGELHAGERALAEEDVILGILDAIALALPVDYKVMICRPAQLGVAVDSALRTLANGFDELLRATEFHIRNPHRNEIVAGKNIPIESYFAQCVPVRSVTWSK